MGTRKVTIETPAKINLTLEVLGKRDDGYHEIASVMQAVSLFDTLTLSMAEDVQLISDVPEIGTRDNLVYRAAELLKREKGVDEGVEIRLSKGIPIAAGMGGGSSDAAATLLGLNLSGNWVSTLKSLRPWPSSWARTFRSFSQGARP